MARKHAPTTPTSPAASGTALGALRQEIGIPQHIIAETAGIAPHTLARIERGARAPSPVEVARVTYVLNTVQAALDAARAHAHTLLAS